MTIQDQLTRALARKEQLEARIAALTKRVRSKERRERNRRYRLIAEWVLSRTPLERVATELDRAGVLQSPSDRALFGLSDAAGGDAGGEEPGVEEPGVKEPNGTTKKLFNR